MLKQPMIEKLLAMRLHGMAESLKTQEQDPAARDLSFLERLGLLVDQQSNWRENQALGRRLKNAKLRTNACVEEIDYRGARGLDKSVIRALCNSRLGLEPMRMSSCWPTSVGKSFVACALAQKACRDGYSAFYTRAQSLFRDLAMARADGSLRNLLVRLARIDVLVIDDWAMATLLEPERGDFWEICEDRYQVRSMILTLQLPVSRWHEQIGDPTLADVSSTGWSIMPTESRCVGIRCVRIGRSRADNSKVNHPGAGSVNARRPGGRRICLDISPGGLFLHR